MSFRNLCIVVLTFLLLGNHAQAAASGSAGHQPVRKALPLDGLPGLVLKTPDNSQYLPGTVVVKLLPGARVSQLDEALAAFAVTSVRQMFPDPMIRENRTSVDLSRFYIVTYTSPLDAFALAAELADLPVVQYAEPSFIYPVSADPAFVPNDPYFSSQYGLTRIQAPQAWDLTQGDTSVVIGIVDTGVELVHPDLAGNIWHNPGEMGTDGSGHDKRFNGIDDDGDGYVDDWQGWDFCGANYLNVVPDNNPSPTASNNEHGTHVAGIASASTNNGTGVAGTGFHCRILAVKTSADNDFRGPGGTAYIIAGYEGIAYAAFMGANVINCSWGGPGGSQTEQDLINYVTEHGTVVVAAAGNGSSSSPFYPASYQNVLSVAATGSDDVIAGFSNYGQTIGVCAPGISIMSTIFPSTYTNTYSGTSMASPFGAGTAALVKSMFPGYTAKQVREQVRVTADDIDAVNPLFAGLLGKGRVNAYRAVSVSSPAIRASRFVLRDSAGGNNNGNPEPNETVDLYWTFTNYLAPTTGAVVMLTTTTPGLTVTVGTLNLGVLGTLDTLRNTNQSFRVALSGTVASGLVATLTLTVTDGGYSDFQYFNFVVNPTYQTHSVNQVSVTMTNNGRIGFNDYSSNTQGVGFIYPAGGQNVLFEGGLIIGRSASSLVDNVRNTGGGQDNDFVARQPYHLQTPGVVANQDGSTVFSDSSAPGTNRIGLKVEQYSYAYTDPDNDDYVIVRYDIRNLTAATISNLFVGQFFDWDIANYGTNRTEYDSTRSLAYSWDQNTPGAPWVGLRALDSAASVRGLVNNGSITPDRASKWAWISGGTSQAAVGPADIHSVISSGPFTIDPGGMRRVGFAAIGGADYPTLQANADFARAKWSQILQLVSVPDDRTTLPVSFALRQNYPNPFNPSTTIVYTLPSRSYVKLSVYDQLGRELRTLVAQEQDAGEHSIRFDASRLSSGVYFYRLNAGTFTATRRMLLLK